MKKKNPIVIGIIIAAVVGFLIYLLSHVDSIDSFLEEYDQLADEAIEMVQNQGYDPIKTLAKAAKFQQKAEDFGERLGEYEDNMTEEQLAEFMRITMKMVSFGSY